MCGCGRARFICTRREHRKREAAASSRRFARLRTPRGATSELPALARCLDGHATGIDDAQVAAPGRYLTQSASAEQRGDLIAFVLIDLAAERCDRKTLHATSGGCPKA